jgi:hypothetical protein
MTATQLYYFPGQKATVFLETLGVDGYTRTDVTIPFDGYVDGYGAPVPVITRVIFPDLSLALNFPKIMVHVDTGLYYFQFTLPTGAASVGSYLVDVTYNKPGTDYFIYKFYQLIVTAPFGNFGVTVG